MGTQQHATPELDARLVGNLRRRLCDWYVASRRDLPWRATDDPYAIWISEAMLQQTRVETVIPYWRRFLARLPTLADLAAADEAEVVTLWSGLGYYRRARALRQAAQVMVERHQGRFPSEREAAEALPGVGPYTAGAVLSIAYGLAEPLVDGNVARVLFRYFGIEAVLGSGAARRRLEALTRRLVPAAAARTERQSPANWNQALMELGAVVCTPSAPDCPACPWSRDCQARRDGRTAELPVSAPRKKSVDVRLEVLVLRRAERLLLRRRLAQGRMAGLWELPTREVVPAGVEPRLWPVEFELGRLSVQRGAELPGVRHAITTHRIQARVWAGEVSGRAPRGAELRFVTPAELDGLALTGMTRKILS